MISVDICAKLRLLSVVNILQNAGFDCQVLRFEDGMLSFEVTLSKQRRQPALKLKKREKILLNSYLLPNFHDCLDEQSTVKQMK